IWSTLPNIEKLRKPLNLKAAKAAFAARNKKLQIVTRKVNSKGKKTVVSWLRYFKSMPSAVHIQHIY
ncbi:unnamed protein product, partial [Symbiodinium sp. CCMP2592]